MALTSTSLTDIGQGAGLTTNFHVQYETTLPNQANIIANANALLAVLETEFGVTTGWFNTPANSFGTGNRQVVNLNRADGSGANNFGYGGTINLDPQGSNPNASDAAARVKMVFMNEWVEVLMSLTNGRWNRGDSSGEGLSQYCGIIRFQAGHYSYYGSWVDQWLNQHPRQDWITTTEGTDTNAISFGCALAFIFYLNRQLNFSINQIIAAGASNLAQVYQTLTGDSGNPWPAFLALLENAYPSSATAAIPGPVTDNPFPLGQLAFWVNKNTFGRDEVQDVINTNGGRWPKAFWLVVEGFSPNAFNALGVTIPAPTGSFANLNGVAIVQNPDIDFENAVNPQAPQRIRIPYDVVFNSMALAGFPTTSSQTYEFDAFLSAGGTRIPASDAATEFELVAGADPYFTNIDPTQNNVFYLSQDLRVFTATPGQNPTPVPGGPTFGSATVGGAFDYTRQLLGWLNTNFSDPNGTDPFSTVLPGQGGALQGDSSVTPLTVDFSNIFNIKVFDNFNFAVARVRLRGTAGPANQARNVRVFFRLWSSQTADTDYQPGTTYPSTPDAGGLPGVPLVGLDHRTLPFFASGSLGANADYAAGGANIRDIEILSGDSVWAYYGCFLNLYDQSNVIDGQPVQAWLNGTHHCLVAQIADDDTPVPVGISPENSDKLAQRNLQVTLSDNPGPADTHRIPQTFDLRPSPTGSADPPDEMMIDWGTIPAGSVASIYWPQVMAVDVLALANTLYSTHTLSAADTHTIQCKVTGGVTYVPIPPGAGDSFAGLFTVDLPTTVVTGQAFNIVVRRIASLQRPVINLHTPPATRSLPMTVDNSARARAARRRAAEVEAIPAAIRTTPRSWRYVTGSFQVTIPVATATTMLLPEQNTLAIMKWRLQRMVPSNRWYPVLQRYISYLSARVDGLGGNGGAVQPSPTGVPVQSHPVPTQHERTGKVCAVLFDCFGDFEGFVLHDCQTSHTFKTREKGIERLVLHACKESALLSVFVDGAQDEHILRLVLRC